MGRQKTHLSLDNIEPKINHEFKEPHLWRDFHF